MIFTLTQDDKYVQANSVDDNRYAAHVPEREDGAERYFGQWRRHARSGRGASVITSSGLPLEPNLQV